MSKKKQQQLQTTTGSEVVPSVQETPSIQGTTRSIGMNGVIESLGVNTIFGKERGTPQKRVHDLLEACQTIVKNDPSIFKAKISTLDVNKLITDLEETTREDMFNSITDKKLFCDYIDLFISSLKSTSDQITKNKIFISVWLLVLVKSISDISQCGSLVNDIQKFYDGGNIPEIVNKNDVFSVLNSNKNVTFVSSDKICAALSSNILKLIDYPIQTLCSRKTGTTTQTMIVQKSEVSALSVILSVVGDKEKTFSLINDVVYSTDIDNDKKDGVTSMITSINSLVTDYYTDIIKSYQLELQNTEYVTQDIIQLEVDKLFLNKREDAKRKLCQLISNISSITYLENNLFELSKVLSSKENVVVPRWTYHVSNDVFKYMFPLTPTMFADLKSKISREEILSATADAMYGHDFALECITNLGREFLTAIGEEDVYKIGENMSYSKKEDLCISQTLQLNNFSTINQHGDKFSINFNSDSNYLVVDRKKMFYRISEIPWNITASPLVDQPIIASVDFVSGEPSISVVLSEQINYTKQQNIRNEQVLAFSTLTQTQGLKEKLTQIDNNTNYKEYYGVTTLYDGAAPYGGLPIYELEQYESSMNILLKPSGKQKGSEENLTLTVTTNTTESEDVLIEKWTSDRIDVVGIKYLNETLIENISPSLNDQEKLQISSPEPNTPLYNPLYKFNLIWGTILNSKTNLTLQFRKEIYDEFKIVVAEIQNKIRQLNEKVAERSRRASTQQPISRFQDYSMFDNVVIKSLIEQIYGAVSENNNEYLQNFDVMMIEYIKILFIGNIDLDDSKYKLLLILESAVRGVCSDDPDGLFKSLLSIKESIQEMDPDEELKKIILDAKEKITRDTHIKNMKDSYSEQILTKRGPSMNKVEHSGEVLTTGSPTRVIQNQNNVPDSAQSNKTAPAVSYQSSSGWNPFHSSSVLNKDSSKLQEKVQEKVQESSQVSDFTETLGDQNLYNDYSNTGFGFDSSNENIFDEINTLKKQIEELERIIYLRDEEIKGLTKEISNYKFPTVRGSDEQVVKSQRGSRENTPFPFSLSRNPSNEEEGTITTKSSDNNSGGSRKNHTQTHKSATRRKNKNSSKRKTIKKRKMPKRKNNTRRNK